MGKYRLFLDRRTWSNASLVVEAASGEAAVEAYHNGLLEGHIERLSWDDDDVQISVVDVEQQ